MKKEKQLPTSNATTVAVSNTTNRHLRSPSSGLDEVPLVPRHHHRNQNEKPKAKGTSTRSGKSKKRQFSRDLNNSDDSSGEKKGNNLAMTPILASEQIVSLANTEASFPGAGPWSSENEKIHEVRNFNNSDDSNRENEGNNLAMIPTSTGEQIVSLARSEASFPEEVRWCLENENIHLDSNESIPTKDDFDEMAMAKKMADEDKKTTPSLQETSKNYLFAKRKPANKDAHKRHVVTHEMRGSLIKHGKASQIDKGPRLMFFDGEEGEIVAPRIGDTYKNLDNLHGPELITIDDAEEAEETPPNEVSPGAVSVNGPDAIRHLRDAAATNANNPITADVENVHTVPEATLVGEHEGDSKTSQKRKFLFVTFVLVAVGVILGWQFIPGESNATGQSQSTLPPTNNSMRDFLSSVSPSSTDALFDQSSPQNKALDWISADSTNKSYADHQIIQRWVVATLFYSTAGEDWTESSGWLSEDHECNWNTSMVMCDNTGNITRLYLIDNNLFGSIPLELGLLSDSLAYIDFRKNKIGGSLPTEMGSLARLERLDMSENNLVGNIPSELSLTSLYLVVLNHNKLNGTIPKELWWMANQTLGILSMKDNQITGSLPSELESLGALADLNLESNSLSGPLPTELGRLPKISSILLGYNQFTGTVPTDIGFLSSVLMVLNIKGNPLVGTIPTELGLLTTCDTIVLHSTSMSNGKLPSELGLLKRLEILNCDKTSLTGTIPSELGLLRNLIFLSLSENDLQGQIPSEIGLLTNLYQLYLSKNELSGTIPSTLGGMHSLLLLWIFFNDLIGPVPDTACSLRGKALIEFAADCDEINCPQSTCCTSCF